MTDLIKCPKCGATNRLKPIAGQKAVCGRCKAPLDEAVKPVIVTDANFADEIEKSALPVLLDLWAAWCGPCRMIAPIVEQLAAEFAGRARVGKLDVDKNPMIAAHFQARSIPTLLILKQGREVDRIIGAQSKEAITRRLQTHL